MPPFPDIDPDLAREQPVATLRYEEHEETGRIWIDATFDGDTLSSLHTSGPKGDVRDYFDGLLTKIELRRKWRMDP